MYTYVCPCIDQFRISSIRILSACVKEIKGSVANRPSSGNLRFVLHIDYSMLFTIVCMYVVHCMFVVHCMCVVVFYALYC